VPHDNDPIVISIVTAGRKVHRVLVHQKEARRCYENILKQQRSVCHVTSTPPPGVGERRSEVAVLVRDTQGDVREWCLSTGDFGRGGGGGVPQKGKTPPRGVLFVVKMKEGPVLP